MSDEHDPLFSFHRLNQVGQKRAKDIASLFTRLVEQLFDVNQGPVGLPDGLEGRREAAIVRTKLEEACFFAKKAMAVQPKNQESK